MLVRESHIEKKVSGWAYSNGWLTYKWSSPQHAGVPDRIFIKRGRVVFIEFKRPGGKPTKLQTWVMDQIKEHGGEVYVVDDIEFGQCVLGGFDEC